MSGALSLQELQPPAPQPTGQRAPLQSSHYSADCTQPKIASREEEEGETDVPVSRTPSPRCCWEGAHGWEVQVDITVKAAVPW